MYLPSDDSILLANCVKHYHGNLALEIGIGSGIITRILCENFETVIGTDIEFEILKNCKNDNDLFSKKSLDLICTDAASPFRGNIFDLIVSNPPYVPDDRSNKGEKISDHAIYGGPSGIEITLHIIKSSIFCLTKWGKVLIIVSSLSDHLRIYALMLELNLKGRRITEKKIFFETLSAVELRFSGLSF